MVENPLGAGTFEIFFPIWSGYKNDFILNFLFGKGMRMIFLPNFLFEKDTGMR